MGVLPRRPKAKCARANEFGKKTCICELQMKRLDPTYRNIRTRNLQLSSHRQASQQLVVK